MSGWDGNGNFTRVHDWTDDRDSGIKIQASRFDAENDAFKDGINACLTKNGENAATANLNLGGYRFTNAGNATARTDLARVSQVQDGSYIYAVAGGTADAITVALSPAVTAYAEGSLYAFRPSADNATTTPTLNVNAVGAKTIKKFNAQALAAGDIKQNRPAIVAYDATDDSFALLNPATVANAIANVVEDTTPQLGGQLDVNGNALGDGTNELLKFTEAGSAVNEITLGNAATGNAPSLQATGDDTNIDLELTPKGTGNVTAGGDAVRVAGKETIWIPAGAMVPSATLTPSGPNDTELATNDVMVRTLDFDASATERAQFQVAMPKSWDEGTVTAQFYWTHGATTTNFGVVWDCRGVAFSDGDALDAASGTAQTVTDTGGTTNDLYISDETGAITLAGSPAAGDLVTFVFGRAASNGSDTLAVDAKLIGVKIFYTTDAPNDA